MYTTCPHSPLLLTFILLLFLFLPSLLHPVIVPGLCSTLTRKLEIWPSSPHLYSKGVWVPPHVHTCAYTYVVRMYLCMGSEAAKFLSENEHGLNMLHFKMEKPWPRHSLPLSPRAQSFERNGTKMLINFCRRGHCTCTYCTYLNSTLSEECISLPKELSPHTYLKECINVTWWKSSIYFFSGIFLSSLGTRLHFIPWQLTRWSLLYLKLWQAKHSTNVPGCAKTTTRIILHSVCWYMRLWTKMFTVIDLHHF